MSAAPKGETVTAGGSTWGMVKTVAWAFFGVRKRNDHERDTERHPDGDHDTTASLTRRVIDDRASTRRVRRRDTPDDGLRSGRGFGHGRRADLHNLGRFRQAGVVGAPPMTQL